MLHPTYNVQLLSMVNHTRVNGLVLLVMGFHHCISTFLVTPQEPPLPLPCWSTHRDKPCGNLSLLPYPRHGSRLLRLTPHRPPSTTATPHTAAHWQLPTRVRTSPHLNPPIAVSAQNSKNHIQRASTQYVTLGKQERSQPNNQTETTIVIADSSLMSPPLHVYLQALLHDEEGRVVADSHVGVHELESVVAQQMW